MPQFEELPRLIFKSFTKEMNLRTDKITFFEGTYRFNEPKDGVEFRFDGPRFTELPGNEWYIWCEINVLISRSMDEDFHQKYILCGEIAAALKDPFIMFDDTPEAFGCMQVLQDARNKIQVNHFGQVRDTERIEQSTVTARYTMYYQEN